MTRLMSFVALLAMTSGLAAQDTTHAAPTPAAAAPTPSALSVAPAVVARTIVDRTPQDTGTAFPVDVGQVICFTQVGGGGAGTTVHHVWFHGETQVADVSLTLGGSPWRTWSRKTIPAEWTGAWHVEVRDDAGAVLKRLDFTVGH